VRSFERDYVVNVLRQSGGNVTQAARIAGKERRAFGKLLKKYGIDRRGVAEAN
jgi:two-component system response regulator GlrR